MDKTIHFDFLIPCPYDRSHCIYESKMQAHLFKCERNHKNINKIICPFNATHRIDHMEYMLHINECPNRRVIEIYKYDIARRLDFKPQPYKEPILPTPEENWDEEPLCETYDPVKHVESSCILRKPVGISKSQRKLFYKLEVLRINRIQGTEIENSEDIEKNEKELQSGSVHSEELEEDTFEEKRDVSISDEYIKFNIDPALGLGRGKLLRNRNATSEIRPGINNVNRSLSSSVSVDNDKILGEEKFKVRSFCIEVAESVSRKEYSQMVKTK